MKMIKIKMKNLILKEIILSCLFILMFGFDVQAQTRTIRGKVINVIQGKGIADLQIQVRGYPLVRLNDTIGEFQIKISDTLKKIEFQIYPEKKILEVKLLKKDYFEIYLAEKNLDELSLSELFSIKVNVSTFNTESVFHTPSTVSVIDRNMLQQYNFLNVAEMLRSAVGIDIYQSNNDDNIPTARGVLQNYYANKILIMIDNVPTYQPIYGNTNLDRIDVNDIERIEVLKGPASVLYGSNAYLGVVNIILRKCKDGDVNVRLGSGYHRFGASGANITLAKKDFTVFLSGNIGIEIQKPYNLIGKRQDLYNGDSAISFQRELKSSNFNISASFKSFSFLLNTYEYQHTFLGINPSFISGAGKPMNDYGTLAAIKYNNQINSKLYLLANLAYDFFKRDYASNADGSLALALSGERVVSAVKFNYEVTTNMDVEMGADLEHRINGNHNTIDVLNNTIIRSNLKDAKDINELSAFAQIHIHFKFFNILSGLRYTNNSISNGNFSGRISAVANINKDNSLKLIYGQSFRAPTMLELYFDHPTVVGNPKLEPEKARSVELAYVHGQKTFFVQMLIYYQKLNQLIQRITPPSGPPSMYQNISSFNGYGFEFEAKYQNLELLNAFFNYSFMKGIGDEAQSNYQHIPKHTFKFGLNRSFNSFFTSLNGYAVSSVLGNPKLNIPIKAQYMMDAHIGYKHTYSRKGITITHTLSAKNITASKMLIPEYIRQTDNINSQATTAFGRRFLYIFTINF